MESKKYLDVDHSTELNKLSIDILVLQKRIQALSIDYKNYISPHFFRSAQSVKMNELSTSLSYRFNCAAFHIQLFCNEIDGLNKTLKHVEKHRLSVASSKSEDLFFIFDSTIYHISSIFDYIGSMVHIIHNYGQQDYKKWNDISKSYQSRKESTYELVHKIQQEFADKFFSFRSKLIHETVLFGPLSLREIYSTKGEFIEFELMTSQKMLSHFKELKELSTTHNISLKYSLFYIMNKVIFYVTQILFKLKNYVELNKRNDKLAMTELHEGKHISASKHLWHEHLIE